MHPHRPFGCSVPAMQLVMRCNALLSLYSALKSASFSSGLAMMARFSFLFFQTKRLVCEQSSSYDWFGWLRTEVRLTSVSDISIWL